MMAIQQGAPAVLEPLRGVAPSVRSTAMREHDTPEIPYGYCYCGCGQKTSLARDTNPNRGDIKGQPVRYVRGHSSRGQGRPMRPKFDQNLSCWRVPVRLRNNQFTDALIDHVDLPKVIDGAWGVSVSPDGVPRYACRRKNDRIVYMHRLVLPDAAMIDHINGNGLDNRRANLRSCSPAQNNANSRDRKTSSSGYIGVYRVNRRFHAQVQYENVVYRLGYFDTPEEAAHARDAKAIELHGEFAVLNFPRTQYTAANRTDIEGGWTVTTGKTLAEARVLCPECSEQERMEAEK